MISGKIHRHLPPVSRCGLAPDEFLELVVTSSLGAAATVSTVSSLAHAMAFLLNLHANVDDRHRASCQEVLRRVLRRAPLAPPVYLAAAAWRGVLGAQGSLALGVWAEDWGRRLAHIRAFLLLSTAVAAEGGEVGAGHTLATVFEAGDGRVAELVARWALGLAGGLEGLVAALGSPSPSPAQRLLTLAGSLFPASSSAAVVTVHAVWEVAQAWSRHRPAPPPPLLPALWSLHCPALRARLAGLAWRTFFLPLVQEVARLTEAAANSSLKSRAGRCSEALQLPPEAIAELLVLAARLLDCQLQSLSLGGGESAPAVTYDPLGGEARAHLLEHLQGAPAPELEEVSVQHQLVTVLELSWSLGAAVRPLQLFSSAEGSALLQARPGVLAGLFVDRNVAVGRARAAWVEAVVEAAVARVHRLAGAEGWETAEFQAASTRLLHLTRLWFLTDLVRVCQVDQLYRAGLDSLALELRAGVTDLQGLASRCVPPPVCPLARCLEVALLRVAKHVWAGEGQGRLATLPAQLVPHLAERRDEALLVSEAGLADTVALLAWTTACLEDEDRRNLSTSVSPSPGRTCLPSPPPTDSLQALAAAQVLVVRNNRGS